VLKDITSAAADADRDAAEAAEEHKRAIESIGNAITGAIQQADSFADALRRVALELGNIALQGLSGAGPLGNIIGPAFAALVGGGGGVANTGGGYNFRTQQAKGDAFSGGNIIPFARGGIVNKPTIFPMANGMGLMGEAGPEAVMPLVRGPNGKLGVQGGGGGTSVTVQIINNTPAQVREERGSGPNGEDIRKFIIDEVDKGMARGSFDKSQRSRFGIAPQRVKR